ncbi:MAG: hypothetical protein OXF88_18860 [Rhodobacteraceae bacterium]|nr:hypothetical protein [Paracoccaceae bacterium]
MDVVRLAGIRGVGPHAGDLSFPDRRLAIVEVESADPVSEGKVIGRANRTLGVGGAPAGIMFEIRISPGQHVVVTVKHLREFTCHDWSESAPADDRAMRFPGPAFPRHPAVLVAQLFGFPPSDEMFAALLRQALNGGPVVLEDGRAPVPAAGGPFREVPDALLSLVNRENKSARLRRDIS